MDSRIKPENEAEQKAVLTFGRKHHALITESYNFRFHSESIAVLQYRAEQALAKEDIESAYKLFNQAFDFHDLTEILEQIVEVSFKRARTSEICKDILQDLNELIRRNENNSIYYAQRMQIYFELDEEEKGFMDFRKVVSFTNNSIKLLPKPYLLPFLRSFAEYTCRFYEENTKKNPRVLMDSAQKILRKTGGNPSQKESEELIKLFSYALQLEPDNLIFYRVRANIYKGMKQNENALLDFLIYCWMNFQGYPMECNYLDIYIPVRDLFLENELSLAIICHKLILEKSPDEKHNIAFSDSLIKKAQDLKDKHFFEDALENLEVALKFRKKFSTFRLLINTFIEAGKLDEARARIIKDELEWKEDQSKLKGLMNKLSPNTPSENKLPPHEPRKKPKDKPSYYRPTQISTKRPKTEEEKEQKKQADLFKKQLIADIDNEAKEAAAFKAQMEIKKHMPCNESGEEAKPKQKKKKKKKNKLTDEIIVDNTASVAKEVKLGQPDDFLAQERALLNWFRNMGMQSPRKKPIKISSFMSDQKPIDTVFCFEIEKLFLQTLQQLTPGNAAVIFGGTPLARIWHKRKHPSVPFHYDRRKDIDVVTNASWEDLLKLTQILGKDTIIKVIPTARPNAFCLVLYDKTKNPIKFDITKVDKTTLAEFLSGCDFTLRTFTMDQNGNIYDILNRALKDLEGEAKLATIIPPDRTFEADPMRILHGEYLAWKQHISTTTSEFKEIEAAMNLHAPKISKLNETHAINSWIKKLFLHPDENELGPDSNAIFIEAKEHCRFFDERRIFFKLFDPEMATCLERDKDWIYTELAQRPRSIQEIYMIFYVSFVTQHEEFQEKTDKTKVFNANTLLKNKLENFKGFNELYLAVLKRHNAYCYDQKQKAAARAVMPVHHVSAGPGPGKAHAVLSMFKFVKPNTAVENTNKFNFGS